MFTPRFFERMFIYLAILGFPALAGWLLLRVCGIQIPLLLVFNLVFVAALLLAMLRAKGSG
jgi:hypothetical protein